MKINGMKLHDSYLFVEKADEFWEQHFASSFETPLRVDAFDLEDDEKVKIIAGHFQEIMRTLGLDIKDDSLGALPIV